MNSSPQRGTFGIEGQLKRVEEGKQTIEEAQGMIDFYKSHQEMIREREATDEWKIDNMEYDLRSNKWICDKAKVSEVYAQNLYAAMCNNEFTRNDVWPILAGKRWSCSWRYAGGIISDMIEKGDYIDWYCSGIRGGYDFDEEMTEERKARLAIFDKFVAESEVTDEIREDLLKLGWIVVDSEAID